MLCNKGVCVDCPVVIIKVIVWLSPNVVPWPSTVSPPSEAAVGCGACSIGPHSTMGGVSRPRSWALMRVPSASRRTSTAFRTHPLRLVTVAANRTFHE